MKFIVSKKVDTEKDKKIVLIFSDYKSGIYKIVFSAKDTFNNPIESVSNFEIRQSKISLLQKIIYGRTAKY